MYNGYDYATAQMTIRNVAPDYYASAMQDTGGTFEFSGRRNSAASLTGSKNVVSAWMRAQATRWALVV